MVKLYSLLVNIKADCSVLTYFPPFSWKRFFEVHLQLFLVMCLILHVFSRLGEVCPPDPCPHEQPRSAAAACSQRAERRERSQALKTCWGNFFLSPRGCKEMFLAFVDMSSLHEPRTVSPPCPGNLVHVLWNVSYDSRMKTSVPNTSCNLIAVLCSIS